VAQGGAVFQLLAVRVAARAAGGGAEARDRVEQDRDALPTRQRRDLVKRVQQTAARLDKPLMVFVGVLVLTIAPIALLDPRAFYQDIVVYNIGHLGLRLWGFRTGLRHGRGVGGSLARAALGAWTERLRAVDALLLGILTGAVLGGSGGLAESGALWTGLALCAFVVGDIVGHRIWRPTAVAVVTAVALLATWGVAS